MGLHAVIHLRIAYSICRVLYHLDDDISAKWNNTWHQPTPSSCAVSGPSCVVVEDIQGGWAANRKAMQQIRRAASLTAVAPKMLAETDHFFIFEFCKGDAPF